ncbi:MAG: S8 family serine peptidase, partial [Marinicellaceae bacterium]
DRASYSNYGNLVDLAGPGGEAGQEGVASLLNDGTTVPGAETYVYYSGTSMATPRVAGVAALMYSVDPNLTPDEVETILKDSSRAFPNGSSCSTNTCGDGMLDAAAALAAVGGGGGNPPTNQAPNASFSYTCNDLACSFDGSGSSDSDGSISSYSWSFGASGSTANNTFGSAGSYSVTLTVTDNEGATDNQTQSISVTEPVSSSITMTIGENRRGNKILVYWSGASGNKVDVYKNGSLVSRTRNDGAWNDKNVSSGVTYTYQVCEQGSTTQCSDSGTYSL